ncbi:hypothetical protein [uncultured Methylibium sp.]|uniref:hypothetical protein n=1 Tax=uncultured Methylibium sp. TaxID=381093 RepID=UPI0025EBE0B7|nr:hypothetical protein [uncultured Methylibium sp.]
MVATPASASPRKDARRIAPSRLAWLALCGALLVWPAAQAQDAASLRARHAALRETLSTNAFRRPLHVESRQGDGELRGDIHAVIEQPYASVGPALTPVGAWCDILMLHLNVKQCTASRSSAGEALRLAIGRKFDQPLADAYRFEFGYRVLAARPDYLHIALQADEGPLGTRRYRIQVEVVALDAQRSFLHMSYSYAHGAVARMAMQTYLATAGRDKVGFSVVGTDAGGRPVHVGGTRGVIERNTMRYYLAVEAYLGALAVPAAQRQEKRLNDWHSGVERYPLQLHELERDDYLRMKRGELRRQQASLARAPGPSGRLRIAA